TILGQSRLPMVMAEDGLFPKVFARTHPRFGTPTISLLVGGLVLTPLVYGKFSYLTAMFSMVQVLAYLLIFAALLPLRSSAAAPESGGSGFRIPLRTGGLIVMIVPCVILSALAIVKTVWDGHAFDTNQAGIDLLVLASGPITYRLFSRSGRARAG